MCDPWAVGIHDAQSTQATPGTGAGTATGAEPLPKWLLDLTKKHHPARANLDAAYQRTVNSWRLSAIWRLAYGLQFCSSILLTRTPSLNGRVFLALWVVIIGFIAATSRVSRRGLWLGAATAEIGLRGEAGLRWMSGLREIPRLTRYNLCTGLLLFAWLFLRPFSSTRAADALGPWLIVGVAYTVAILLLLAGSIGTETRAYDKVRAYLATVPPDPTADPRRTAPTPTATTGR